MQVLLENHIYWTALFDELEHNIAKDVYYTNFVAESNGDILLTAKTKTYHSVAEQLQIFQKADFVQSVEVSSASQSAEETVDEFAFETGELLGREKGLGEKTFQPAGAGDHVAVLR